MCLSRHILTALCLPSAQSSTLETSKSSASMGRSNMFFFLFPALPTPSQRARQITRLISTGHGGNFDRLVNVPERVASRLSDVSYRRFRLPRAWASRANFANGSTCCGLVLRILYFLYYGGSFCSSLSMRSISLTTPTTRRLLSKTGRHGRFSSRMIFRASSSD
jgi:hypothetical protein